MGCVCCPTGRREGLTLCHCITCHPDGPIALSPLTPDEVRAMNAEIARLTEALQTYVVRYPRSARKGAAGREEYDYDGDDTLGGDLHARSADPDTSKASSRDLNYGTGAYRVLEVYAEADAPLTANEVQKAREWPELFRANKRCSDLLRHYRFIDVVGVKTDPISGKENELCVINDAGRKALVDALESEDLGEIE